MMDRKFRKGVVSQPSGRAVERDEDQETLQGVVADLRSRIVALEKMVKGRELDDESD